MNVKQCDVVLLPVPFSDQTARKVRPAIVVSNDSINASSEDVILVPLTSVLKDVPYSITITQKSFAEGKLIVPSRARADKLFTAHKSLVKMKIGKIELSVLAEITKTLMRVFGIENFSD